MGGLTDLEALLLACRSRRARAHLTEAVACYKAGANRAAIVMTWLAVVFDLISKLEELALGGDVNAQKQIDQLAEIIRRGDTRQALDFEQGVLELARDEFELLNPLAYSDLVRLREDRHKSAHPSMLDSHIDYQPSSEAVRYHMVSAANHVLIHGPAQGKAAMSRLLADLDSSLFPAQIDELIIHLEHGPLGRPRQSLIRNYVLVVLKEMMFPPAKAAAKSPQERFQEGVRLMRREPRLILTLQAVSQLHGEQTTQLFKEKLDELTAKTSDERLFAVVSICAKITEGWHALSKGQQQRLVRFVREAPRARLARVLMEATSVRALAEAVEERFSVMGQADWDALAELDSAPPAWVERAITRVESAKDSSEADPPRRFLAANVAQIQDGQVRRLLAAAAQNDELTHCWGITDVLFALGKSSAFGKVKLVQFVGEVGLEKAYAGALWWSKFVEPPAG